MIKIDRFKMNNFVLLFLYAYILFIITLFLTNYSFIFKSGITNLSVHFLILFFFIALFNINKNISGQFKLIWTRIKCYLDKNNYKVLLFFSIFVFLIFAAIGIFRHYSFGSWGQDIGGMDNALWNAAQGNGFISSIENNINYLGVHFWPILYLVIPFYAFWPNIIILYLLNALALSIAILALYWIAKRELNEEIFAFVFIFVYFINRSLQSLITSDFYTDVFIVPLSLFAYLFISEKRNFYAVICFMFMLLCKENAAFLVAAFGIFILFNKREILLGSILIIVSAAWWIVITNFVMPYFAKTDGYWYAQWLPYGKTYSENIKTVILNPFLLGKLFFHPEAINFYLKIFGPLGFLPFLSPAHYILFLVPISTQVIGGIGHPGMLDITSHYQAHTLPFIFIAAIYGTKRLLAFFNKNPKLSTRPRNVSVVFVYLIIAAVVFYGKSTGHRISKFIGTMNEAGYSTIAGYLAKIPRDASVIAVPSLVPHLSHRPHIYLWKNLSEYQFDTQYVVLYKRFMDTQNENFSDILNALQKNGYIVFIADQNRGFYILKRNFEITNG